ncbi:hypothetical protein LCGC14_0741260 [marine sediment metagenome]|uniref:DUF4197 domain-containing protein n=1 Tax=marine sediment metagenome TaxID=412755 RepID=A0A0F9Q6M7_9ZZZZ|nr:DUF4197 domain-containing protein [Methylophaga sp.]HEC59928.1 DUF4197 domain-containing protein [Methylophaga sp.]
MRQIAVIILLSMGLSSCSSFIDDTKLATQAKFQQFVAGQFGQRLDRGIDLVIDQLKTEGGYLDNPLVRILLPPPLGVVIGTAREMQVNPKAALLETLINQAAENTIPVAGPILKNIVMNMTTAKLQTLITSDNASATNYLKEQSGAALQTVLLPAITEQLHANGAIELYSQLLKVKGMADQVSTAQPDDNHQSEIIEPQAESIATVKPEQLGQYVVEKAMSGLFKKVAEKELSIRKTGDIDLFKTD